MSMLPVCAELANVNTAPITDADRKRAAFFNLSLPSSGSIDGHLNQKSAAANEIGTATVREFVPEPSERESPNVWEPGDSLETWTDGDAPIGLGQDAEQIDPEAPASVLVQVREPIAAPTKLAIHGFQYSVRTVPVARECGSVAFELVKLETNNRYHVRRDEFGVLSCDCPDYLMRHDGAGTCCKHGKALVDRGLMPAPAPIPSTLGRREFLSSKCSVWRNATPTRRDYPIDPELIPAPALRRFVPSPEEMAEAAAIFAEVEEDRRAWRRQYAEAL